MHSKVTRVVKVITGIGANEDFEEALLRSPQGFMSTAAMSAGNDHTELLEKLEKCTSTKAAVGSR